MADTLTSNPIIVDLNSGTSRVLYTGDLIVTSIALALPTTTVGTITVSHNNAGAAGAQFWRYALDTVAAALNDHYQLNQVAHGLYIALTAQPANSFLFIYYR